MKQSIHFALLFLSFVLFQQQFSYAQSPTNESSDPFADYVEKTIDTTNLPKDLATKYPKFDAFLQQKLHFSVPAIGVEQLKEYQKEKKDFYLLDTRGELAFNTSHIPGAKRIGYDDFSVEKVWTIPRDAHIVVYCTTGVKSEQIGEYLEDMGFTNVENLYGAIIDWVNEDGTVIDKAGKPTQKVVVKDKQRKDFLKKGKAIILEESEVVQ